MAGDLKSEWYTAINPNGRAPAVVHVKDDGTSVKVFESAACLLYLASEFDQGNKVSYPIGTPEYWSQLSWVSNNVKDFESFSDLVPQLSWQVAGYGPMVGQAAHFNRYVHEPAPYGSWRFTSECRRLQHVLDKQLVGNILKLWTVIQLTMKLPQSTSSFVAGDRLTIADIAIFIFAHSCMWAGIDINESPNVKTWHDKLAQRPAFQKGLQVPVPYQFSDEAVTNPEGQDFYKMIRKSGGHFIRAASEQWQGEVVPLPSDHANY
jgi:glutathione S-transferase